MRISDPIKEAIVRNVLRMFGGAEHQAGKSEGGFPMTHINLPKCSRVPAACSFQKPFIRRFSVQGFPVCMLIITARLKKVGRKIIKVKGTENCSER